MPARDRRLEREEAEREYHPCDIGIHVCGQTADGERPLTVLNIEAQDEAHARRMFAACREQCEAAVGEPRDYIVDLNISRWSAQVEDFGMSRQMLERMAETARAVSELAVPALSPAALPSTSNREGEG